MKLKNEPNEIFQYDESILGDRQSNVFFPNQGFKRFKYVMDKAENLIPEMYIVDESNTQLTVDGFLDILRECNFQF